MAKELKDKKKKANTFETKMLIRDAQANTLTKINDRYVK
jgi:hypothetical protein